MNDWGRSAACGAFLDQPTEAVERRRRRQRQGVTHMSGAKYVPGSRIDDGGGASIERAKVFDRHARGKRYATEPGRADLPLAPGSMPQPLMVAALPKSG
jgi:hypothetical protein